MKLLIVFMAFIAGWFIDCVALNVENITGAVTLAIIAAFGVLIWEVSRREEEEEEE